MKKRYFKFLLATFFAQLLFVKNYAQVDTTHRQTIEITSSYKPALRDVVKINLYATAPPADTSRPRLAYNIPAQNLFYLYQPVTLKPFALQSDTSLLLGGRNILKVGFGNFTTPYIAGAMSFGDGKKNLLNIYGDYISSKGKIANQDFSELKLKGTGSIFNAGHEAYGSAAFAQHEYYQYGYDHNALNFDKDMLRRSYQDFAFSAGYRNTEVNSVGINYDPHITFHSFNRQNKVGENTFSFVLPATKKFGDHVEVKVSVLGNVNAYQLKSSNLKINSQLYQIAPELAYYSDRFNFHGGITPSWNNNVVSILPNLYGELQLQKKVFMLQGGWVGRFINNSFRSLSNENPYIEDPVFFYNTKEMQYYGGIKATVGQHFTFNAKAAFITYNNMPLFINDQVNGNTFLVVNESRIDNFQIHGDLNFISQDKFTLTGALDLNTYGSLKDNTNAWGLYPLKLQGSFRWNAFKQLLFKADLAAFSGAKAFDHGQVKSLKGGTDLSAGGEFKINNKFSAWLDFDNILNSKYQKWNNYAVYGFQAIGGVIIHF
ncbi:MAG: hypothetical protein JSS98_11880 [Bacteroidetes bacterium]|nr:hypothetical protein [Bacteroidota bacterium]